jgi:chemotaxis protein MotB
MLKADLKSEINQGLAQIEKVGDQIMISLSAANSFRSGFAELQPGFLGTLRNVGDSVVAAGGEVQISGHTDNIPIAFSQRFDSNWDLSAARAASVADFFFTNNNLDSNSVSVFGYADTKPLADNANAQGRAANRRIEILIDG